MTANGLAKLIEECGELMQVAGKKLAYYHTDRHPDGGKLLAARLEEEIADVLAAIDLVGELHGLDVQRVDQRRAEKLRVFREWHARTDNNEHGIDSVPPSRRDAVEASDERE